MIYFDNASTTKIDKEVLALYKKESEELFANPNSIHHLGMVANNKIDETRNKILKDLSLSNSEYEVVFTSSATEANNLAIKGYCLNYQNRGKHIVTTKTEHASVLEVFKYLEEEHGFIVDYLDINSDGTFDIEDIKKKIRKDTILVCLTPVNNEVGLIVEVEKVLSITNAFPKVVVHLDCAQTLGKVAFNYKQGDMITLSSHKIHGVKNIACLIKKKKINLKPIIHGGGQEYGYRSGTQDTAAIMAFGLAINKAIANEKRLFLSKNPAEPQYFYKKLVEELSKIDNIKLHLYTHQSPYILNFSLLNKKASVVVEALSNKGIYVSSVSACSSKKEASSYVLEALGCSEIEAKNPIRLSFSNENTIEEAMEFLKIFKEILATIRS